MDVYRLFPKQRIFDIHLFLVLGIDVPSGSVDHCEWFSPILCDDGRHDNGISFLIYVHLLFGDVIYEDKAEDAGAVRHHGGF